MDARTRRRADAGDADACARLGMALLEDLGTSGAGVAEAAGWLERAVVCGGGRGHPEASFTLGCLAARCAEDAEASGSVVGGDGVAGLRAEAEARWTDAADKGHGRAACFLGKLLLTEAAGGASLPSNASSSSSSDDERQQDARRRLEREEAGLRWLERAAGAGDALGMYNLGVALWGRGQCRDAVRRWEGAAKLGDPEARLSLALVLSGEGGAAADGHASGGRRGEGSTAVAVDAKRALAHAKAAAEGTGAEAGGPRAMLLLANFLAEGMGCDANLDEAMRWRTRALAAMSEEERLALGHEANPPPLPSKPIGGDDDAGPVGGSSRAGVGGRRQGGAPSATPKRRPPSGASKDELRGPRTTRASATRR